MAVSVHRFPLADTDIGDIKAAIGNHVLPDYAPVQPFMRRDQKVIAAGSCFAENIVTTLKASGVDANLLRVEEALNTPYSTNILVSKIARNATGDAVLDLAWPPAWR